MGRRFGRRSARSILTAPLRRRHYRALAGALRRYPTPLRNLWRYLLQRGSYPYRCRIRTPLGEIAPTLPGPHDMLTVTEVFCAGAYSVGRDAAVIVDFGANIGITALYFLTEAPGSRLHLFEPNPALARALGENLAGFADRVQLSEVAISTHEGSTEFGVEPSGRYGGIGVPGTTPIEVPCRSATAVLEEILRAEGKIDLLKIDVEGIEIELLRSLPAELLPRIGEIQLETAYDANPLPGAFRMSRERPMSRLRPISR